MDPDHWEFANEWFLKGQTHLLKNIGRKRQILNRNANFKARIEKHDEEEDDIATEIARLKEDQKVLEQELVGMNKRLEVTERRPEQMMALLHKVAEDPHLSHVMIDQNKVVEDPTLSRVNMSRVIADDPHQSRVNQRSVDSKRQRIFIPPSSSMSWQQVTGGHDGGTVVDVESEAFIGCEVKFSGGYSPEPEVIPPVAYPFSLLGGGF